MQGNRLQQVGVGSLEAHRVDAVATVFLREVRVDLGRVGLVPFLLVLLVEHLVHLSVGTSLHPLFRSYANTYSYPFTKRAHDLSVGVKR